MPALCDFFVPRGEFGGSGCPACARATIRTASLGGLSALDFFAAESKRGG